MATGDIGGNIQQLLRELRTIKYPNTVDEVGVRLGDPVAFLPLLHFCLLKFSKHVALAIVNTGIQLVGKTDQRFVEYAFKLAREQFRIRTVITPSQFLEQGFAERKVLFVNELVQGCKALHNDEVRKERLAAVKVSTRNHRVHNVHDKPVALPLSAAPPQQCDLLNPDDQRGTSFDTSAAASAHVSGHRGTAVHLSEEHDVARWQAAIASPRPPLMWDRGMSGADGGAPSAVAAGGSSSTAAATAAAWSDQRVLEAPHPPVPPANAPTIGDAPHWSGSPAGSVTCHEQQSGGDLQHCAAMDPATHSLAITTRSHPPAQLPAPGTGGWFQGPSQAAPPDHDARCSRPFSASHPAPTSAPTPSPDGAHTAALAGHPYGWHACDAPPAAPSDAGRPISRQSHAATCPSSAASSARPSDQSWAAEERSHPGLVRCSAQDALDEEGGRAPPLGWHQPAAERGPGLHPPPGTAQVLQSESCCSPQPQLQPEPRIREHQPPPQHDLHAGQGEDPLLHRLAAMESELKHLRAQSQAAQEVLQARVTVLEGRVRFLEAASPAAPGGGAGCERPNACSGTDSSLPSSVSAGGASPLPQPPLPLQVPAAQEEPLSDCWRHIPDAADLNPPRATHGSHPMPPHAVAATESFAASKATVTTSISSPVVSRPLAIDVGRGQLLAPLKKEGALVLASARSRASSGALTLGALPAADASWQVGSTDSCSNTKDLISSLASRYQAADQFLRSMRS